MPNRRVLALLALVFSFPAIAQTQITTFEKVGDKTVVCSHSGLTSSFKNIVKGVVASAINENGEEIFPRKWNDEYINAPMIDSQHQPSTTADQPYGNY